MLTYKTFYPFIKDICKQQRKINLSRFKKDFEQFIIPSIIIIFKKILCDVVQSKQKQKISK